MDLTSLFLFCLISLAIGAVLMLIVQYYIYIRFVGMPTVTMEQRDFNKKYALPEDIRENATKFDPDSKAPLMALNLIMQYLFHELRHTTRVRRWFYRKLSMELHELVQNTTTGKLFDKLTLKDLDLGDHFPEIKILRVHDVELHETEGCIENLDLLLDIKYTGNFRLAIDADMLLGKKASVTLKVKRLLGLARLQFTRRPYSHWSLSFLGDPELDLGIQSKFQGRQMQSNICNLISSQIRRAVRRKHTLPKYKIRYKPFFQKVVSDEFDGSIQPNGNLQVKVSELSRLLIPDSTINNIYCTLTMAPMAWVEAIQNADHKVVVLIDIEIHKAKNQQIGILFRQGDFFVEIEAILPNTPAIKSNLKSGDILISIGGTKVHSIQHVAKIVKGLNETVLILRIKRVIPGNILSDTTLEDCDIYEDLEEKRPSAKSISPTESISQTSEKSLPRQGRSNSSSESSIPGTPTNSPKRSKLIAKAIKKTLNRDASDPLDKSRASEDASNSVPAPSPHATPPSAPGPAPGWASTQAPAPGRASTQAPASGWTSTQAPAPVPILTSAPTEIPDLDTATSPSAPPKDIEYYQKHSTIECTMAKLIHMDDLCQFKLDPNTKYLNVCVYGKSLERHVLLGYANIPIRCLLGEYSEMNLIKMVRSYNFRPPVTQDLKSCHPYVSTLSGFEPNLCFGDILLTFSWDGNSTQNEPEKKPTKLKCSSDKAEGIQKSEHNNPKTHNFIRTHFQRTTQCDFCGKKIWLKDAVQCADCSMTCHKKCITKCEKSTVCGPVDVSGAINAISTLQPEFTVTEAPPMNVSTEDWQEDDIRFETNIDGGHRQSLTGLIAQGLKRVNSANNLAIPGVSSSLNQNSKSLPPSPQHSPRKQSLVNQSVSPFIIVTQILESIPIDLPQLTTEQINNITEPIINISRDEDMMTMAKEASKRLFTELSATERVDKINELLTKLRLALDSETSNHSRLLEANPNENSIIRSASADSTRTENSERINATESRGSSKENMARRAFELSKSEERVQALSVIMLYLCTGLQHAQGVASQ